MDLRLREQELIDLLADGFSRQVAYEAMGIERKQGEKLLYRARRRNGFGRDTRWMVHCWRMERVGFSMAWWFSADSGRDMKQTHV